MGLDIYVQEKNEADRDRALEAIWEAGGYPTEEQRRELDERFPSTPDDSVSLTSRLYPEHYWNRRYMRSSYNAGGFNSAVPEMLGEQKDIYWAWEPLGRDWYHGEDEKPLMADDLPNLAIVRERAAELAKAIRDADTPLRSLDCTAMVGPGEHMWNELPTEHEVLEWVRGEVRRGQERPGTMFRGYQSAKGLIQLDGITVLGLTVGQDIMGRPAAIAVFEADPEVREEYAQSAEIMTEIVDEIVALIERDGAAYMRWSG